MKSSDDTTPQAKAARVVYHLLLRKWMGLPGMTNVQVCVLLRYPHRSGSFRLLAGLSAYPDVLPVRCVDETWAIEFEPLDLTPAPPTRRYTGQVRAGLVTHRLICRALFMEKRGISRGQLAPFLGASLRTTSKLLRNISTIGGVPIYALGGRWFMEMHYFDIVGSSFRDS